MDDDDAQPEAIRDLYARVWRVIADEIGWDPEDPDGPRIAKRAVDEMWEWEEEDLKATFAAAERAGLVQVTCPPPYVPYMSAVAPASTWTTAAIPTAEDQ